MTPGGAPSGPGPASTRARPGGDPDARSHLGLPRERRLKRRRLIRSLFEPAAGAPGSQPGQAQAGRLTAGVIQIRWSVVPRAAAGADTPLQVGFAAGRRARTKVGRNYLRRVMRETWRANQAPLLDRFSARPADTLTVFALFRGTENGGPEMIRRDLPRALTQLDQNLAAGPPASA